MAKANKKLIILSEIAILICAGRLFFACPAYNAEEPELREIQAFSPSLLTIQGNCLLPISEPSFPDPQAIQKIKVVITGYSSTEDQTDSDPFITASGTSVREGILANNLLPFGTKVKIPEIYGDKIFVVEDRMHWTKGNYHIDIWFPSYYEALSFGAKRTYIEVLEN